AADLLLAYTLAPMHLSAFGIPRGSGKTTWEPTSSSTPTATPCFCAEILGFEPPGTPQIQQVYGAMDPLLAYTLAPMHLSAFDIPRGSGKTTWEPTSASTSTATPCFCVEILGSEPLGTPQIRQTFMPSRRRPPAAVGKPSFAYFPVDKGIYLMMCVGLTSKPTCENDISSIDATPYERSEDIGITLRNPRNDAIPLA
ncbi:hypothetical protein THAOC_12874, partial [Thalassiosira oceanica]